MKTIISKVIKKSEISGKGYLFILDEVNRYLKTQGRHKRRKDYWSINLYLKRDLKNWSKTYFMSKVGIRKNIFLIYPHRWNNWGENEEFENVKTIRDFNGKLWIEQIRLEESNWILKQWKVELKIRKVEIEKNFGK